MSDRSKWVACAMIVLWIVLLCSGGCLRVRAFEDAQKLADKLAEVTAQVEARVGTVENTNDGTAGRDVTFNDPKVAIAAIGGLCLINLSYTFRRHFRPLEWLFGHKKECRTGSGQQEIAK